MTERESMRGAEMDPVVGAWHGWGSPVGLGLFFVLVAVAVDLARMAFR